MRHPFGSHADLEELYNEATTVTVTVHTLTFNTVLKYFISDYDIVIQIQR